MNNIEYILAAFFSSAYFLIALALIVLICVGQWRVFTKAGEYGWAAFVPFYSQYVLFRITWGKGILFWLLLIPLVNVVIAIITDVKLARAFGKGNGFALGLIFFPSIFMPILGLGDAQYLGVPE